METDAILLVEDNVDDAELTMRALRRARVVNEIAVVGDGQEALEYIFGSEGDSQRDPTLPRLVLLDINLPKVSGLEVLMRLRADERTRHLPVVILTSSASDRNQRIAEANFAHSYMTKPVDFVGFAAAIQDLDLRWLVVSGAQKGLG